LILDCKERITMKLIVVRHAAAVERSSGISEETRYLTPEGRVFFRKTARTMLKNGVEPGLILTSPLLRAVQTADILAETLAYSGPFIVRDELKPGFDMQSLDKLLDDYRSADELVLVGHEPDLGTLVAYLISRTGGFNFKKGAAVKLKIDPSNLPVSAAFKWLAFGKKLFDSPDEAMSF
jgi:phosphohistidine phosphatase